MENHLSSTPLPSALTHQKNKLRIIAAVFCLAILAILYWMKSWEVLFFLALPAYLLLKSLRIDRAWNLGQIKVERCTCLGVRNRQGKTILSFAMPAGEDITTKQFVLSRQRKVFGNTIETGKSYWLYYDESSPDVLLAYEAVQKS